MNGKGPQEYSDEEFISYFKKWDALGGTSTLNNIVNFNCPFGYAASYDDLSKLATYLAELTSRSVHIVRLTPKKYNMYLVDHTFRCEIDISPSVPDGYIVIFDNKEQEHRFKLF